MPHGNEKLKQTMKNKERLLWVDYGKGIGILLIVILHVISGIESANLAIQQQGFALTRQIITTFASPAFLFLSGLFTERSYAKRSFGVFLTEKVKALLYPYLIWTIIMGSMQVILANYTNGEATWADLLNAWYLPLGHLWFLYTLTIFYTLYAIAKKASPKNGLAILSILALLLAIFPTNNPNFTLTDITKRFIYFIAGILYQKYLLEKDKNSQLITIVSIGILLIGTLYTFTQISELYTAPSLVVLCLALIGIYATIQLAKTLAAKGLAGWLVSAGKYSLAIYLAHPLFTSGIRIILDKFMGFQNPGIHVVVGVVAGMLIPIWLYRISGRLRIPYLFSLDPIQIAD